ncbi:hypothetical protein [Candidatus Poriferisodalis sp.]|uniref:hypothetical protein n=1 Tax=Candidatus Poriferisodalis sp. TaxID=3101277 RepID=UPI003B011289
MKDGYSLTEAFVLMVSMLAIVLGLMLVILADRPDIDHMRPIVFGTGLFTGGFVMALRTLLQ